MRKYYPEYHTPDALARQIGEVYEEYPNALIVGSLGRSAAYHSFGKGSFWEFEQRGQNPLYLDHPNYPGVTARDVDWIGVGHDFAARTLPFWMDATSYTNDQARMVYERGEWVLTSGHGFSEPVDPAVMEPVAAETIYGIQCLILPPETQLALLTVRGSLRPKDTLPYSLLEAALDERDRRLPDGLFTAFERLNALNATAQPETC